jgi:hypothetical protein
VAKPILRMRLPQEVERGISGKGQVRSEIGSRSEALEGRASALSAKPASARLAYFVTIVGPGGASLARRVHDPVRGLLRPLHEVVVVPYLVQGPFGTSRNSTNFQSVMSVGAIPR